MCNLDAPDYPRDVSTLILQIKSTSRRGQAVRSNLVTVNEGTEGGRGEVEKARSPGGQVGQNGNVIAAYFG